MNCSNLINSCERPLFFFYFFIITFFWLQSNYWCKPKKNLQIFVPDAITYVHYVENFSYLYIHIIQVIVVTCKIHNSELMVRGGDLGFSHPRLELCHVACVLQRQRGLCHYQASAVWCTYTYPYTEYKPQ